MTSIEQEASEWAPFSDLVSTPEDRRNLAMFLVGLATGPHDMDDVITAALAQLAGRLDDPKERQRRFEELVTAFRGECDALPRELDRARARVDAAVVNLCEVAS